MRYILRSVASVALMHAAPAAAVVPTAADRVASPAARGVQPTGDVLAVAKANPNLSTFVQLAERMGLATTLASRGPLTVLAPDNAAFAKSADQMAELQKPENAAKLQRMLLYHVIPGAAPASALKGTAGLVDTAAQLKVKIDGTGAAVKVDDATVTRADLAATNGTIHIIDSVLMPAA